MGGYKKRMKERRETGKKGASWRKRWRGEEKKGGKADRGRDERGRQKGRRKERKNEGIERTKCVLQFTTEGVQIIVRH